MDLPDLRPLILYGLVIFYVIPLVIGFIFGLLLSLHFTSKDRKFFTVSKEERILKVFIFTLFSTVIFVFLSWFFFYIFSSEPSTFVFWASAFVLALVISLRFTAKNKKYYIKSMKDRILLVIYISLIIAGFFQYLGQVMLLTLSSP